MASLSSVKTKKVLIITSSGGGGLLQAACAKAQEVRTLHPSAVIIEKDVMKDWMWSWMGRLCVGLWNRAQLRGNVKAQTFLGFMAPLAEYFFWPHIFFFSLRTLFKEDIDQVIDTQVMGTSALLKALRWFNRRKKKEVHLEKVLVDLPTKKATHFFLPIKSLNLKDREWFRLITIAPLLEKGETEEEFWRRHCNLGVKHLQYEDFYVRQAFHKYRQVDHTPRTVIVRTKYQNPEELELISRCLKRGSIGALAKKGEIECSIAPEDRVFTVLLGSQPANDATSTYVKKMIELAQQMESSSAPVHLFVFCANHQPGASSLLRRVAEYVEQVEPYPSFLTVIPMSFQNEKVIAPLFFRSNATCTRSGGQTAMELMCTARGDIWIHSEAKAKEGPVTDEELLLGIPGWESANAAYLQQKSGAKIVTPDSFLPHAKKVLLL